MKELNSESLEKFLNNLMNSLLQTKVRFFYCLNPFLSSSFNEKHLLMQMQNFSLIDFIVQFKSTMSNSYTCPEFFQKYRLVLDTNLPTEKNIEKLSEKLSFRKDHFLINSRKVFISKSSEKILDRFLALTLKNATTAVMVLQKFWKKRRGLQRFRRFLAVVVRVQALFRGRRDYFNYWNLKYNTVMIQKWYRERKSQRFSKSQQLGLGIFFHYLQEKLKSLKQLRESTLALVCQKLFKGHKVRKQFESRLIISNIISSIVNTSWQQIFKLIQTASALKIQKKFRGFQVRKRLPATLQLFLSSSARKSLILIQKHVKSFLISSKFQRLRKSCRFIQTFWRFRRHCQEIKRFSVAIVVIQKRVKTFLLRIREIKQLLTTFLMSESSLLENQRYLEHSHLFSTSFPMASPKDSRLAILSQISQSSGNLARLKLVTSGSLSPPSKAESFRLEKMNFFVRVSHLDLLGDFSIVYQNTWGAVLEKVVQECLDKEDVLMDVKLAECHSLALTSRGRVLAWGWNDMGQCLGNAKNGRFLKEFRDFRILQVECGDNHSLALTEDGIVLAFGDNSKGQLGLGHYSQVRDMERVELPQVKTIASKGCVNLAVTTTGQAFIWPFDDLLGQKSSIPSSLLPQVQISEVSLGFNFALLLSETGNIYSFGQNSSGQLGLGNRNFQPSPCLVKRLLNEKISGVSAGLNHCLARSTLGKLFLWGGNHRGQLGFAESSSKMKPFQLPLSAKVIQVSAGNGLSLFIQENRKVFISADFQFEELFIADCLPEFADPKMFAVVRARCEWNRLANLVVFTFCDLRNVRSSFVKVQSGVGLLAARWGKSIEPPIVETLAPFYSVVAWRRSPLRNV
jgi:myosin-5